MSQHTITDRELHTLVQEYLGRHPRYRHLLMNEPERACPDRYEYKERRYAPRGAQERPQGGSSSMAFLFGSPYRCEPCKWGIEELPVPWPDGARPDGARPDGFAQPDEAPLRSRRSPPRAASFRLGSG